MYNNWTSGAKSPPRSGCPRYVERNSKASPQRGRTPDCPGQPALVPSSMTSHSFCSMDNCKSLQLNRAPTEGPALCFAPASPERVNWHPIQWWSIHTWHKQCTQIIDEGAFKYIQTAQLALQMHLKCGSCYMKIGLWYIIVWGTFFQQRRVTLQALGWAKDQLPQRDNIINLRTLPGISCISSSCTFTVIYLKVLIAFTKVFLA